VVDCAFTHADLGIVQDPVEEGIQPTEKVVEHRVTTEQLRAVASAG
jgi:uncharacterized membrane protein